MKRDHVLFLIIGLLAGFLGGYLLHESMARVQPAPLAASGAIPEGHPPVPAEGGGGPGGGPQMADIQRLRAAVEANPDDADALLALANLNFDIQGWDRARELYERYLALRPQDPDAMTDLGICLRALGDYPGALARFAEAQKLAPGHWQSRFNEVIVKAFDLRDLPAAEAALAQLEREAPQNPDVARLAEEVRKLKSAG
jgi:Tfp pilus assembly protein PilF